VVADTTCAVKPNRVAVGGFLTSQLYMLVIWRRVSSVLLEDNRIGTCPLYGSPRSSLEGVTRRRASKDAHFEDISRRSTGVPHVHRTPCPVDTSLEHFDASCTLLTAGFSPAVSNVQGAEVRLFEHVWKSVSRTGHRGSIRRDTENKSGSRTVFEGFWILCYGGYVTCIFAVESPYDAGA